MDRNYYAIIPANVRYDKDLPPNAKLLYGEVTALANDKGYCWASNSYFAELYAVTKKTVSTWIKSLEDKGYLFSKLIYKENSKEIKERRLYLDRPMEEKTPTYEQIVQYPREENFHTPMEKKVTDNNTVFNNTFNNTRDIKNKRKKPANADFTAIFSSYTSNQDLIEALNAFVEMRVSIKKKPTERAIKMILSKLDKLSCSDEEKVLILEQSILKNWTDVYELKQQRGKVNAKPITTNGNYDSSGLELL